MLVIRGKYSESCTVIFVANGNARPKGRGCIYLCVGCQVCGRGLGTSVVPSGLISFRLVHPMLKHWALVEPPFGRCGRAGGCAPFFCAVWQAFQWLRARKRERRRRGRGSWFGMMSSRGGSLIRRSGTC